MMILHSDEEIAKVIDVCYADSLDSISHVFFADFDKNYVMKFLFDEDGILVKDGWGFIPVFYRAKIIPVYKGE